MNENQEDLRLEGRLLPFGPTVNLRVHQFRVSAPISMDQSTKVEVRRTRVSSVLACAKCLLAAAAVASGAACIPDMKLADIRAKDIGAFSKTLRVGSCMDRGTQRLKQRNLRPAWRRLCLMCAGQNASRCATCFLF